MFPIFQCEKLICVAAAAHVSLCMLFVRCCVSLQSKDERQQRARAAKQRRQRWRDQADAEAELDWERYGKYDMLHELLQTASSDPALQVCRPPRSVCNLCTVH